MSMTLYACSSKTNTVVDSKNPPQQDMKRQDKARQPNKTQSTNQSHSNAKWTWKQIKLSSNRKNSYPMDWIKVMPATFLSHGMFSIRIGKHRAKHVLFWFFNAENRRKQMAKTLWKHLIVLNVSSSKCGTFWDMTCTCYCVICVLLIAFYVHSR